ncbi:antibiotic biosynthesis monooxygenase [Mycoplasmopsis pullorum]|nr:antibiotic biosynthesis monooxygenase [Mycoplasmopsis pullorum]
MYTINPEKIKGFIDYLHIFVKKARMETQNLSFEYGLNSDSEIVLLERWSTKDDYLEFEKKEEMNRELKTLAKMALKVDVLYSFNTIK